MRKKERTRQDGAYFRGGGGEKKMEGEEEGIGRWKKRGKEEEGEVEEGGKSKMEE